jgi:pimeloyl-ACP methyl ester carboxylesterase
VAKPTKPSQLLATKVRTRRAYFDCRFGQLHVRTAFPTTGGFDEQVPLFCLHAEQSSSRIFTFLLPEIGDVRSVYAPDLPGCGESDPSPNASIAEAAAAIADLAKDLRLRKIDLMGIRRGAEVAVELAAADPELVRRLVLVGVESREVLAKARTAVPNGKLVDVVNYSDDIFTTAPKTVSQHIGAFLSGALT